MLASGAILLGMAHFCCLPLSYAQLALTKCRALFYVLHQRYLLILLRGH